MNLEEAIAIVKEEWEADPQLEKDRDEVIAKYGQMFKLENIDNLTKEDIQGFWNFKNNKHWSNLDRPAGHLVKEENISKLKIGLKILLDEKIPLTDRIKRIREKTSKEFVNYFKNSLYTPILLVTNPKKYPVVNLPVLEALNELDLYYTKNNEVGKIEWETIPKIQKVILDVATENNFDLWQVDWLWWKIARPEEKWTSNLAAEKAHSCFIITQNQDSKYDDVDGKQYRYDSQKSNKKFIVGSKFITQSKIKYRRNYFTGFGKIGEIKEETVNDNGKTISKFTAVFSEYKKFDSPKVRTDDVLDEMKSLPEYDDVPPSILPISRQLFKKITTEDLGGDDPGDNVRSSHNSELLEDKKQVIFYGPPGTGKTRAGILLARSFVSNNNPIDFEKVRINKIIQRKDIQEINLTDDQYHEYVLKKISDEAQLEGYTLTQGENSEHLYSLKNGTNEIRLAVHFSHSSTQSTEDLYLGVPTKMVGFLSGVSENNRFHLIINDSVKNFVLLPYEIEQKYARFVDSPGTGKWDVSGIGQHAYHITITKDGGKLPVRDGTYGQKTEYDCEKFVRNIKMIFGNFIRNITFHPSYSYEEFVEGIRPKLKTNELLYEIENGIFKLICDDARDDSDNKYVLFIDEINRGNISKIFGELIALVENDKRELLQSSLTYTKESFTVPKNLFIIGTMNTADKSLSLLDVALRRRFGFIELVPDKDLISDEIEVEGEKFKPSDILVTLNKKIKDKVGRERQIGHSYFMKDEKQITTGKQLQSAFENEIVPLLQEYLYEENEDLLEILGEGFVDKDELELKKEWKEHLKDFKEALGKLPDL